MESKTIQGNTNPKMNLYEKLAAVTHDMTAVEKDLDVGYGTGKYKGTSEAVVLANVKPLEEKYRIYSFPFAREIVESKMMKTTSNNGKEGMRLFMRIKTTYRFVDMDAPDQYIDITSYGDGLDSQDKSPGKAMTYSDKYALLKAYKIITGDDPDVHHSDEQQPIMGVYQPQSGQRRPHTRQQNPQGGHQRTSRSAQNGYQQNYQQRPPANYQNPQGEYQQPQGGYQQSPANHQQPAQYQGGYQQPQYQQQPAQNYQQPPALHPADIPPAEHPDRNMITALVDLVRSKGADERFILNSAKVNRLEDMSMFDYNRIVQVAREMPEKEQSHLNL